MKVQLITFVILCCIGCESNSDRNSRNRELGFHNLPCDNISEAKVKKYPIIFDSLIKNKILKLNPNDSIVNYKILGVQHPLSLLNCKINKLQYNATVEVKTINKNELWEFQFKNENNKIKLFNFYKSPQIQ